jgi:subtilisin-like proprotein convertase family protein
MACILTFSGVSTVRATTFSFESVGWMAIPDNGPAEPYPSSIAVASVPGTIVSVKVTLNGFTHSYPDDLAAVVVGPSGDAVRLFDGPGSDVGYSGMTWTFSDSAAFPLPDVGMLSSGTYQPGQNEYYSALPQVTAVIQSRFEAFAGSQANGVWSLYLLDAAPFDSGSLSSWGLELEVASAATPEPSTMITAAAAFAVLIGVRFRLPRW